MSKIFLTAGHHKNDPGAVNKTLRENILNRDLVKIIITRAKEIDPSINIWTDNFDDPLSKVISQVKSMATDKDVWIEIHFDSSSNIEASGTTAIVSNNARNRSKNIARRFGIISKVLNNRDRGVITESQSARGKLGMLSTVASSVLLEVEFMSNDIAILNYEKWRFWVAEEIAKILLDIHNEIL